MQSVWFQTCVRLTTASYQNSKAAKEMTKTVPDETATKKRPLVVVKKKKTTTTKHSAKTSQIARKNGGIPSFGNLVAASNSKNAQPLQEHGLTNASLVDASVPAAAKSSKHHLDAFLDGITDEEGESFPSEALIAIDTLTTSRREFALEIPFPERSRCPSIYGVLECQIQEFYRSKNAGSSQSLCRELEVLVESGAVIVLASPADAAAATSIVVYVKTNDYLAAVHDALTVVVLATTTTTEDDRQQQQHQGLLLSEWFAATIVAAKGRWKFTYQELCTSWNDYARRKRQVGLPSAADTIKTLQDKQVLLSVSAQSLFQLSLPTWGELVLPAFRKASKDTLTFIKQSRYKERSVASLEKRLSRSPIAVARLLIPWMTSQGLIQRHEKPSGMFVSLAPS
jgi:hypothetical protein